MKQNVKTDNRLMGIQDYINQLSRERDDLEWAGQFDQADLRVKQIEDAKAEQQSGVVYYPLF